MTNRKALAIGLIAIATLSFSACSDNSSDKSDDTTTTVADTATTAAGTDGSTIPAEDTAPEDTAPSLPFDEAFAITSASVEAAGDDPCALAATLSNGAGLSQPTSFDEAIKTFTLAESIYLRLADLAPDDVAAEKATIEKVFNVMIAEAKSPTVSVEDYLQNGPQSAIDPSFVAALQAVEKSAAADCPEVAAEDT